MKGASCKCGKCSKCKAKKPMHRAEGGDVNPSGKLGGHKKHPRTPSEVVAGAVNRVFTRAGKSPAEKKRLDDRAAKAKKEMGY